LRVLLLNPPFHPRFSRSQRSPARTRSGNLYYPIWLGYATGALEQEGHSVLLLDGPARGSTVDGVCRQARDFGPDLIVTDTSTPSIENDLAVAGELRRALPHVFQVLVGTHATALPEPTLEQAPWVDAIARREYDFTLRELAVTLANGDSLESVTGLSYRAAGEIRHNHARVELRSKDLDSLPFVSDVWKKHVRIQDYRYSITPHPQITLVTGRGCPYKCDFCVWPQVLTGHQYRRRSVANVVEEFTWIGKHLPNVHVFLEDDTLTVNRKRCHELAEGLIQAGNKVRFTANSRADVDFETLAILKRAGLRMVCTGFESADDEILSNIEKRLRVDQSRVFAADAKKAGVLVHGCFMVGCVGETNETLGRMLDLACELDPDSAQFFPLMVYPGTKAYDRAQTDGALVSTQWSDWLTKDGLHNTTVSRPALPPATLVSWCNYARRRFYLRPRYLLKKLGQSIRDRDELMRNLQAARELMSHLVAER
jgi:anaerobic magnesium-protoporphyrin IX monomethyl ester cyclase